MSSLFFLLFNSFVLPYLTLGLASTLFKPIHHRYRRHIFVIFFMRNKYNKKYISYILNKANHTTLMINISFYITRTWTLRHQLHENKLWMLRVSGIIIKQIYTFDFPISNWFNTIHQSTSPKILWHTNSSSEAKIGRKCYVTTTERGRSCQLVVHSYHSYIFLHNVNINDQFVKNLGARLVSDSGPNRVHYCSPECWFCLPSVFVSFKYTW